MVNLNKMDALAWLRKHLDDDGNDVLREMVRALRSDGDGYLLEPDGVPPEVPQAFYTPDLRPVLEQAGFSEVRRTRALSAPGDAPALVVIHVRPCAPRTCPS